jgi:hypothetical protein
MHRAITALTLVVPLVAAAPTPATAATTTIQFSGAVYDSPGADTRSATSLNAEWIRLTNRSRTTIDLRGWTIRDAAGKTYRFATTYRLAANRNVYLHTGRGTDGRPDVQHRYWQSGNYVWNNPGDTATLRNPAGQLVDTCRWTTIGTGSTTC